MALFDIIEPHSHGDDCCATHWPIYLVHGVGYRQASRPYYWGRIPETLEAHGAVVWVSTQDAWGSAESNAWQLHSELNRLLDSHQVEKANLIGYSKGGLDSRVLATLPGMQGRIASLTTIATPHGGIRSLDWLNQTSDFLKRLASTPIDIANIFLGDESPSFVTVCTDLSALSMEEFNARYPEPDDIFIQSYSAVLKSLQSDPFFAPISPLISLVDGDNDGIVPKTSARFGEYQGSIAWYDERGLSHRGIVDRSLLNLLPGRLGEVYTEKRRRPEGESFDILAWWVEMVADLRQRGF